MENNYESYENGQREMSRKLDAILESAEAQHPFSKNNFISMKRLVFLWIIGDREKQMKQLLQREIRQIVEDEKMICMIESEAGAVDGNEIYNAFYEGVRIASHNYLSIDMDNPIICPIFLPGCFGSEADAECFANAGLVLQREFGKRQRYPEWRPFMLLKDENVSMTRTQVRAVTGFIETVAEYGRTEQQRECCSPCCVITDLNEWGQEISLEQRAKTIVMLTVFRNTDCQNSENVSTLLLPAQKGNREYFFTARAVSICEPVKSLTLNRLLAVHEKFLEKKSSSERMFEDWNHGFFESGTWREQLDKVAHDEKYAVLTAPIYSNIPVPDAREYEKLLRKFCDTYYFTPLSEGEDRILEKWWRDFWEQFFNRWGSLENLEELEKNSYKILEKVPPMRVARETPFCEPDMRAGCERWLAEELQKKQSELVGKALNPDGVYMKKIREKKELLKESMRDVENLISNRIRRLRQTELLLNTGGGHIADSRDEARYWMQDYINSASRKVTENLERYQKLLCSLFQEDTEAAEGAGCRLLDIYYKTVSGTIESREEYMKNKLAGLAGSDMGQLIARLGENWLYPMRRVYSSPDNGGEQRLYVMGDKSNFFCRKLLVQDGYRVAFKESSLDDRLEIIRVSDRFTGQQICSEEQEREKSGSVQTFE